MKLRNQENITSHDNYTKNYVNLKCLFIFQTQFTSLLFVKIEYLGKKNISSSNINLEKHPMHILKINICLNLTRIFTVLLD